MDDKKDIINFGDYASRVGKPDKIRILSGDGKVISIQERLANKQNSAQDQTPTQNVTPSPVQHVPNQQVQNAPQVQNTQPHNPNLPNKKAPVVQEPVDDLAEFVKPVIKAAPKILGALLFGALCVLSSISFSGSKDDGWF